MKPRLPEHAQEWKPPQEPAVKIKKLWCCFVLQEWTSQHWTSGAELCRRSSRLETEDLCNRFLSRRSFAVAVSVDYVIHREWKNVVIGDCITITQAALMQIPWLAPAGSIIDEIKRKLFVFDSILFTHVLLLRTGNSLAHNWAKSWVLDAEGISDLPS